MSRHSSSTSYSRANRCLKHHLRTKSFMKMHNTKAAVMKWNQPFTRPLIRHSAEIKWKEIPFIYSENVFMMMKVLDFQNHMLQLACIRMEGSASQTMWGLTMRTKRISMVLVPPVVAPTTSRTCQRMPYMFSVLFLHIFHFVTSSHGMCWFSGWASQRFVLCVHMLRNSCLHCHQRWNG